MKNDLKYMKAFIAEAEENLQNMNNSLLELEKDPARRDILEEMFRYAHTIKGGAASMGYEDISSLAHEMENLMDKLRSQTLKPDSSVIDILFETLDLLETLIDEVSKQEKSNIDITPLINKLKSISLIKTDLKAERKEEEQVSADSGKDTEIKEQYDVQIKITLQDNCVFKSVRAFMVLKSMEEIGKIVNTAPEIGDIEDEKFDRSFTIFLTTKENKERISKIIESISEIENTEISSVSSSTVNISKLSKAQTVRVDVSRLNKLMNLVGELVIDKARLVRISSMNDIPELEDAITHLARLTTDIQDEIMQARLVPVDMIFKRFPRMVRDLAKNENKKIDLIMEGTEIEVDRTILDKISDPLIHLLRNAVDHGIETSTERKKTGKPETGVVKLIAYRQKEHVVIEVSDDGKGMDPDSILDIAIKKGIITSEEGVKLNDKEKLMLICAPGLSTKEDVTDVSGRGVGVDVVKTNIESLGGTVTIESKKGVETKFTLKLPLTMAIVKGLLVQVQQETFVVPLANVEEIVHFKSNDVKTIKGEEVISLREEVLPLMRLDKRLKLNLNEENKPEIYTLVVDVGGKRAGLVVDNLLGQQEIVIKPLDNQLKGVKEYAGATILGDGKVVLILDVPSLVLSKE